MTTNIEENNNSFVLEQDNITYNLVLSYEEDKVHIKIQNENGRFENSYSLPTLEQKSKIFHFFTSIMNFSKFLSALIEKKQYQIIQNDKTLLLKLVVNVTGIGEEEITLSFLKDEKEKNLISGFYDSFTELHKRVNEYEILFSDVKNEFYQFKKEIEKLNNELSYLQNENNNLRNERNQLREVNEVLKEENKNLKRDINTFKDQMQTHLNELNNNKIIAQRDEIIQNDIIVELDELNQVYKWISPNKKITSKLLYKATRDGDKAETFHKLCNGISPTLTLIKTSNNYRFGGYTEAQWESSLNTIWKTDENSFIFSLDNKKKYKCINSSKSICCNANDGPCFGYGCDIGIRDNFLSHNKNFNSTPSTYKTSKKYELNNGDKYFNISELEIYKLTILSS